MNLMACRTFVRVACRCSVLVAAIVAGIAPAGAQNKKRSWEVFLYFGSFFSNDIPKATQRGEVTTQRVAFDRINVLSFGPNGITDLLIPNLGAVGGDGTSAGPNDPNYNYPFVTDSATQVFFNPPCNFLVLGQNVKRPTEFLDECDADIEARYKYNASGIQTNGSVEQDDMEFTLGLRTGYNITRHWEVELDLGFGKQRLNMTKNLVPLLTASVNDVNDPRAPQLAKFFQFTFANRDYAALFPSNEANREIPSVIASRLANDPNYNIPVFFPQRTDVGFIKPQGKTFDDVTEFINEVLQDPTAFRNRANQINMDVFTVTGTINYNFNTKADSRFVPYLSAGAGRWFRRFDTPFEGDDSSFLVYGGGIRLFVNEIFSFRADFRAVTYTSDSFTITGKLTNQNLKDITDFTFCFADQPGIEPPCIFMMDPLPGQQFPNFGGGGGNASLRIDADLDDFFEIRFGFDVILGGR